MPIFQDNVLKPALTTITTRMDNALPAALTASTVSTVLTTAFHAPLDNSWSMENVWLLALTWSIKTESVLTTVPLDNSCLEEAVFLVKDFARPALLSTSVLLAKTTFSLTMDNV